MRTLVLAGELDGLMRVSRVAESFYHGYQNVNTAQNDLFAFKVIKGMSHAQFAIRDDMPDFIK